MEILVQIFSLDFMRRALAAGLVLGALCAALGVFIVQRGLAFLGDGLAHASLGGIALALLLGVPPFPLAVPWTVGAAIAIVFVKRRSGLPADTAIGIFFATSVALGILFIGLRRGYSADVVGYLFGSILAVEEGDLLLVLLVGGAVLVFLARTFGALAYATFDRELAAVAGVRVVLLDYLLIAVTAVVIVLTVRIVGIILTASYLVIPAATGRLFAGSLGTNTVLSVSLGVGATAVGLVASYFLDVPSGATIILTLSTAFAAGILVRRSAGP